MGQQQLLILVFGIVLVGGAVVAGAHALEGGKPSNSDHSVFQEALSIVADVQLWKLKPHMIGGGNGVSGFDGITFRHIGYRHALLSKRVYKTDQGCYMLRILGPERHAELTLSAPSCAPKHFIARVVVSGTTGADLAWYHDPETTFPELAW